MTWWYQLKESVRSVMWYARTVWKHRWWDYGYQLTMIDKMLEECEKNWVKRTHYEGDKFTLGRIRVVRSYYKEYLEAPLDKEVMVMKKFLREYTRLLPRLWD